MLVRYSVNRTRVSLSVGWLAGSWSQGFRNEKSTRQGALARGEQTSPIVYGTLSVSHACQ
jgi:hypothetical protein